MTDQTFSEARTLLRLLFEKHGEADLQPIEIVSHATQKNEHMLDIGNLSIVETSINLNAMRRKNPRQPFIHTAIPDIIIKNDPGKLLLTFENWQKNIVENHTIEFYLLPRGTFEDIEKKLLSLVDGSIQIHVSHAKEKFQSTITPVRLSKPEYHLKEYPYAIEGDRFLIQWEGEFTDRITGITKGEIDRRKADLEGKLRHFKVTKGGDSLKRSASLHDYWLFSQLQGKTLYDVKGLFPESFDSILDRIVRWKASGILQLSEVPRSEVIPEPKGKAGLSLTTKLGLRLPLWLTVRLFRRKTGAVGKVPVDLYLTGRYASEMLIRILMQKAGIETPGDVMRNIQEMESNYNNYETRKASLEHVKALGESPGAALGLEHLPKTLKLALKTGYGVDVSVKQINDSTYEFTVSDCFFCRDSKADSPVCTAISGGMEGLSSIMFKKKTEVEEIECRAMGSASCRYRLIFP